MDGRALRDSMEREVRERVRTLREGAGIVPRLVAVAADPGEGQDVYHRMRKQACERVGIVSDRVVVDESDGEGALVDAVRSACASEGTAVLVEQPIPKGWSFATVMDAMDPLRDVEGLHPANLGRLLDRPYVRPCTPAAVLYALDHWGVQLEGAEAVIINHSRAVGRPLALLLLDRNATVTVCHIYSRNARDHARRADVVVTGTGVPGIVDASWIREGAAVIDVGIARSEGRVVGDVAADVDGVAGFATPVPGGIGPLTVAHLLVNAVTVVERTTAPRGL